MHMHVHVCVHVCVYVCVCVCVCATSKMIGKIRMLCAYTYIFLKTCGSYGTLPMYGGG